MLALSVFAQEHAAPAHGAEGGEHHEDNTTMWKWANFAILAALMGYGISKAAGPFFQGRSEQIRKALVEARMLKEEADARAAEIDRKLASLSADIEALKAEARAEMAAESERVQAAIKELRAHAAELALDMARRKIASRLTVPAQERLVDQFLARLEKSPESLN
jgi:F0F1-type ATP synthase membrane subunit b/b'